MALSKEVYSALEDVVGPEYICNDPVIMHSYHATEFAAVVLPENTAQVQALIRLCNQHKLPFRPVCTGWTGKFAPGTLYLDLRRMNRIIEINEKNMYAVVEPYVITAQLQAELMKRGLHLNVKGAGSNCSAMLRGHGHLDQTTSGDDRNHLAIEWVTPAGDIVRSGSLGSADEWFCGDGPGPSLRGLVRGNVVTLGGLGVYTRAALKIYHWAGPPTMEVKGCSPDYVMQNPGNFMLRYLSWPDEDGRQAGIRALGESEIAFGIMGFNPNMVAGNMATSNEKELVLAAKFSKEIVGPGFCVVIAGNSPRDFAYKKMVLEQIIKDTKAASLKDVETGDAHDSFIWRFIRVTSSIRETMRATGVFGGEVFGTDSYLVLRNAVQHSRVDKQELIDEGLVYPDNVDPFITSLEQGQLAHSEVLLRWTPAPDVAAGAWKFVGKANQNTVDGHYGLPHHLFHDMQHDFFGPYATNYTYWLRRLKKSFDPNAVSEASNHLTAKGV